MITVLVYCTKCRGGACEMCMLFQNSFLERYKPRKVDGSTLRKAHSLSSQRSFRGDRKNISDVIPEY